MDQIVIIKFISALAYPIGLAFTLAFLGLFFGWLGLRWLRFCCWFVCLVGLLAFSNPMIATSLLQNLEQQYPQKELEDVTVHDAIIVLGGGLRIPLPPAQHTQIGSGSDRYWYAARLYRAGKAKQIVLAGGNVYAQPGFQGEAYYASILLQEWGVPKSAIVVEQSSRTTQQNLSNITAFTSEEGISSALLVTSAYHMPRAYGLFKKLPFSVTPASADIYIREHYSPAVFAWIPSSGALSVSTMALHEYYGMWFSAFQAFIDKR